MHSLTKTDYWRRLAAAPSWEDRVVDKRLKVYGVWNLGIIDVSVMPISIGANTCLLVSAVVEKASDF